MGERGDSGDELREEDVDDVEEGDSPLMEFSMEMDDCLYMELSRISIHST